MNLDPIAEAMDAERAQIAHEIHDALLPLIFAASAAIDRELDEYQGHSNQSVARAKRLRQASTWLREALQVGRQILIQTHPPELAADSWHGAARKTIAMLTGHTTQTDEPRQSDPLSQAVKIDWQIDNAAGELDESAAGACYRIAVEAIRNAVRHSGASEVTVTANRENGNVVVCVSDNGSGFEVDQVPADRFGIRSMKARATLVGGKLILDSKPGGPTTVRLSVPASD